MCGFEGARMGNFGGKHVSKFEVESRVKKLKSGNVTDTGESTREMIKSEPLRNFKIFYTPFIHILKYISI